MTLRNRVGPGVGLCAGVVGVWLTAALLFDSEIRMLQGIGGFVGVLAYAFGAVFFAIGVLIIIGGTIAHLRNGQRRPPNA